MVYIITGAIDSGKTTLLETIHREKGGGGFSLPKFFTGNQFTGYHIKDLKTGKKRRIALLKKINEPGFTFRRFYFLMEGFEFAEKILKASIATTEKNFFIDEIGFLELEGRGFSHILTIALKEFENVYMVVRKTLLNNVVEYFGIKEYNIKEREAHCDRPKNKH